MCLHSTSVHLQFQKHILRTLTTPLIQEAFPIYVSSCHVMTHASLSIYFLSCALGQAFIVRRHHLTQKAFICTSKIDPTSFRYDLSCCFFDHCHIVGMSQEEYTSLFSNSKGAINVTLDIP